MTCLMRSQPRLGLDENKTPPWILIQQSIGRRKADNAAADNRDVVSFHLFILSERKILAADYANYAEGAQLFIRPAL